MAALLARRLIQAVAVLLGVAVITFLLLHYLPADPAALVAGRSANAQMIASVRHQLGLDLPVPLQFWRYLTGLVRGDLGRSYVQRSEVATLVMARIPATLVLMACGILVEVALGLTFGVIAALRRNGFVDRIVMMFAFVGVSSPQFVVALLLLYVFAARLGWFPMSGFGTPAHVVLPALTLGLLGAGWYARMVRSAMIDVLNQDYVRTATPTFSATAQISTASESKSARSRWLRPSGFRRAKWTSPATAYRRRNIWRSKTPPTPRT
jgi:peptide/nickel transport system permease protein